MKFWRESRQLGENYFDRSKVAADIQTGDVETPQVNLFQWRLI
jgi:hypothetical protein